MRERNIDWILHMCLDLGWNLRPRYVPWLGIEFAAFWWWDDAPTNWATLAGPHFFLLYVPSFPGVHGLAQSDGSWVSWVLLSSSTVAYSSCFWLLNLLVLWDGLLGPCPKPCDGVIPSIHALEGWHKISSDRETTRGIWTTQNCANGCTDITMQHFAIPQAQTKSFPQEVPQVYRVLLAKLWILPNDSVTEVWFLDMREFRDLPSYVSAAWEACLGAPLSSGNRASVRH